MKGSLSIKLQEPARPRRDIRGKCVIITAVITFPDIFKKVFHRNEQGIPPDSEASVKVHIVGVGVEQCHPALGGDPIQLFLPDRVGASRP